MNLLKIKEYLSLEQDVPNLEIKGIKMNSKEIEAGDLFLVYGKGIQYLEEAISRGAIAILTEENIQREEVVVLKVQDILDALSELGKMKREEFRGKVIAITGSNGKTTTKELLKFLLSFDRKVLANEESENNHIGVPKTLLQLDNTYDYVLLEMGMNHPGEIGHLSQIAKPHIGIITNIGSAHIGNLGSKEAIFRAKMELWEQTPTIELFVNGLDPYLKTVPAHHVFLEYSSSLAIEPMNLNLAMKVCEFLGYSREELERRIFAFPGVKSRMQRIPIGDKLLIDDAYNASLESLLYGLSELQKYDTRKIVILGDFLELGSYSREIHKQAWQEIQKYPDILLFTIGQETAFLKNHPHFFSLEELKDYFKTFPFQKGDIIYLKASHKIGLSRLISFFKNL